jgi:propanediol dehydratase small subunit
MLDYLKSLMPLIAWLTVSFIFITVFFRSRGHALQKYWDRPCMGIRWRRRFPNSPKEEIREFLNIFVDAFAYDRKRRTCFSPDDRVIDIYRANYPPGSFWDNMDLEAFSLGVEERFDVDFLSIWREGITLGELYDLVRTPTV